MGVKERAAEGKGILGLRWTTEVSRRWAMVKISSSLTSLQVSLGD